jgi:hypothetical protein
MSGRIEDRPASPRESSGLGAPTGSYQGIEIIIQVAGERGGMENSVQLHQRLLQRCPFSLIDCTRTPGQLLISPKKASILR